MPIQGDLKEMSLANLIQVNCQEMRSARLTLEHAGQRGEVYFSDGQVVHATLGNQSGVETVFAMLAWDRGTFVLDRDVAAPAKSITMPWNELLLQGMMRIDEQRDHVEIEQTRTRTILEQLRSIEGVSGAVIAASDGIVLGADVPSSDGEQEAAVAVFIGAAAQQLGETLELEGFSHGIVSLQDKRLLVLQMPDRFVGLVLTGERTSPAIVANAAKEILSH